MLKNIAGQRFGRLLVTTRAPNDNAMAAWSCVCDCGNKTVVRGAHLLSARVKSCGCLSAEETGNRRRTHGRSKASRAYQAWGNMRTRCENAASTSYAEYGGRGIKVCDYFKSFPNFLAVMGEPPAGLTLERKNVNGDYEPSNCIWANWETQQNNRRNTRRFTAFGQEMGLAQWARATAIQYGRLRYRIDRLGLSLEAAVEKGP